MSCILIGSGYKKPNHCRTDAFLKSGMKPKAVKKSGKAVSTGVCLMSIKLHTHEGGVQVKLSPSVLPAALRPCERHGRSAVRHVRTSIS